MEIGEGRRSGVWTRRFELVAGVGESECRGC